MKKHEQHEHSAEIPPPPSTYALTFFVATHISTSRCLMRREGSDGNGVLVAVSTPAYSFHIVPDEKWLSGRNFSPTILAEMSSRILKENRAEQQRQKIGTCQ